VTTPAGQREYAGEALRARAGQAPPGELLVGLQEVQDAFWTGDPSGQRMSK
jgi:hypothetical protein